MTRVGETKRNVNSDVKFGIVIKLISPAGLYFSHHRLRMAIYVAGPHSEKPESEAGVHLRVERQNKCK
jgi:hypothetical protein